MFCCNCSVFNVAVCGVLCSPWDEIRIGLWVRGTQRDSSKLSLSQLSLREIKRHCNLSYMLTRVIPSFPSGLVEMGLCF